MKFMRKPFPQYSPGDRADDHRAMRAHKPRAHCRPCEVRSYKKMIYKNKANIN